MDQELTQRRTKIVCTMGPSVNSYEQIKRLIEAGMNVARINFSHGSHEEHAKTVELLKRLRSELMCPLSILLDTKGPEIRLGELNQPLDLKRDMLLGLAVDEVAKPEGMAIDDWVKITPHGIVQDFKLGQRVLFDDGYIESTVVEVTEEWVVVRVVNDGVLRSRKGINLPGTSLSLPALTQKDRGDIAFAVKHQLEYIAASFIRSPAHVLEIRRYLRELGGDAISILAKIENQEGVDNFDEILNVSDGIMIARGDLGVELPPVQVPKLQKMMIHKCHQVGKPSITATQMLESMIRCPRPTRAEVSDVANAIYDSTSAVMLSGETAVGNYPIEAVEMMAATIEVTEADFDFVAFFRRQGEAQLKDISSSIALATVKTAFNAEAKAIFCFTQSGRAARQIARFRPHMRLFALTPDERIYHQMALYWGVMPVLSEQCTSIQQGFALISDYALTMKLLHRGDVILMTAGTPFGVSGSTNFMMIECLGGALMRTREGVGREACHGEVIYYRSGELLDYSGKVVVMTTLDAQSARDIEGAAALIIENDGRDSESYERAHALSCSQGISILLNAEGARRLLSEGMHVVVDPERGILLSAEKEASDSSDAAPL